MKKILIIIILSIIPTLSFSNPKNDILMGVFYGGLGAFFMSTGRDSEQKFKDGDKEKNLDQKAQVSYAYASVSFIISGYYFWGYFSAVVLDDDQVTFIISKKF